MRGGEILPYAKEQCIGKTTMLEYAKRHLKFQVALHEELEQPLPKSDEPVVNESNSLDM